MGIQWECLLNGTNKAVTFMFTEEEDYPEGQITAPPPQKKCYALKGSFKKNTEHACNLYGNVQYPLFFLMTQL